MVREWRLMVWSGTRGCVRVTKKGVWAETGVFCAKLYGVLQVFQVEIGLQVSGFIDQGLELVFDFVAGRDG